LKTRDFSSFFNGKVFFSGALHRRERTEKKVKIFSSVGFPAELGALFLRVRKNRKRKEEAHLSFAFSDRKK
jgi:hypothetical protein